MQADPDLDHLFADLRAALISGDLPALTALGAALETAVPMLADEGALRRLRQQAEGNAALLRATLQGVRAARRRLEEVTGRAGQSVYDASGRLDALAPVLAQSVLRV